MIDFSKIQHFAFQSTLSVRRATDGTYYNIKSINISIHALREESDVILLPVFTLMVRFQSTLSVRRATPATLANNVFFSDISIHALREESD